MKLKLVLLFGVVAALLISISITFPYVKAWWNMNAQSGKMNVVIVTGDTHMISHPNSSLNVTLIAVYPKAAIEARSDIFTVQLAFFVTLNPNVTELIADEFRVNFRSLNWTSDYYGLKTLSFHTGSLTNLYRRDNAGEIPSFIANESIKINAGRWPPVYDGVSNLLYFAGEVKTLPTAQLQGRVTFLNNSYGFWSVNFNMRDYPTIIYRFNFPPTIWLGYGFSLVIVSVAIVNFFYKRRHSNENSERDLATS